MQGGADIGGMRVWQWERRGQRRDENVAAGTQRAAPGMQRAVGRAAGRVAQMLGGLWDKSMAVGTKRAAPGRQRGACRAAQMLGGSSWDTHDAVTRLVCAGALIVGQGWGGGCLTQRAAWTVMASKQVSRRVPGAGKMTHADAGGWVLGGPAEVEHAVVVEFTAGNVRHFLHCRTDRPMCGAPSPRTMAGVGGWAAGQQECDTCEHANQTSAMATLYGESCGVLKCGRRNVLRVKTLSVERKHGNMTSGKPE
ncbi:hypothetical protein B0H17DRAFT_1126648 [Mycena rosella]|uniref:Uncharacterized protein n=1 Tax=Mycena rosella TaxID=1033263 RepID=A0AAD7GTX3_MYCRO|nr:hypothetical protein B0H17DRAFT_1126648 [Mycena rosella]